MSLAEETVSKDDVLQEVWSAKAAVLREAGGSIDGLFKYLREHRHELQVGTFEPESAASAASQWLAALKE